MKSEVEGVKCDNVKCKVYRTEYQVLSVESGAFSAECGV